MSNVSALQDYDSFQAARRILSGASPATDVRSVDVAPVAEKAGTDLVVIGWGTEQPPTVLLEGLQKAASVSSIGPELFDVIFERSETGPFTSLGAFSALDDSRTPEGRIRLQIETLRYVSRLKYRQRLAGRLEFLLEAMKEEQEPWNEGSPESFRRMVSFLESVPNFLCPIVTVTPSATFRAQWAADASRHFAVDFLPDGQVRFVVFSPDPRHPDRVQRISGITSLENLIQDVAPYKVERWAADARS